jgi:glycosyltransferase involved in cell wall biosynthesis
MPLLEPEQQTFERYKNRLEEFDIIMDNSWLWHTVLAQLNSSKQLPVVHIYHSDPDYLQVPKPPIQHPCIVGLSDDHASKLGTKWGVQTRTVYNGIPLDFYTPDSSIQRNGRYLWLARYTPEKCPLEAIQTVKKCGAELDLYGNTVICRSQDYINQCMAECDAHKVVFHNEATRDETVNHYRTHKALIHLVRYNEAFGLVPLEAMACGTPVLVNRRGALPELVEDGVSGFIVDGWNQVEDIIRTNAVDKIKPEDCRKQALKFSIAKSAEGYLDLFQDIIKGKLW